MLTKESDTTLESRELADRERERERERERREAKHEVYRWVPAGLLQCLG
jgi:hypothetical protein